MSFINIIEKMKNNDESFLEFYDKKSRIKKKHKELFCDVLKVINFFKIKNIKKNDKIGVIADNSYEWILLDIASLFEGIVFIPFHKNDFTDDYDSLIENYNLKLLFLDEIIKKSNDKIIQLCDINSEEVFSEDSYTKSKILFNEDDVFTIIFTSGTTGFPTAIEIRVKSAEDFILTLNESFALKKQDKVISFLPFSVYTARLYIYGAVFLGFNVVATKPEYVLNAMRIYQPTLLQAIPHFFDSIYKSFFNIIKSSKLKYTSYLFFKFIRKILPGFIVKKIQEKMFGQLLVFFGSKIRVMVTGSAPISKDVLYFFDTIGINLFEAYGTNETGIISINNPCSNKIGSVGKVIKNKEVRLTDAGEVLVRGDFCQGFRNFPLNKDKKNVYQEDGFIRTGDIGFFDKKGFLYLKGRSNEIITLSNGRKIHPSIIEKHINSLCYVKQSIVIGDKKSSLTCLIVLNNMKPNQKAYALFEKDIKKINSFLYDYMNIGNFKIIEEEFTVKNGLLSNNMKLNRKNINHTYSELIEGMY